MSLCVLTRLPRTRTYFPRDKFPLGNSLHQTPVHSPGHCQLSAIVHGLLADCVSWLAIYKFHKDMSFVQMKKYPLNIRKIFAQRRPKFNTYTLHKLNMPPSILWKFSSFPPVRKFSKSKLVLRVWWQPFHRDETVFLNIGLKITNMTEIELPKVTREWAVNRKWQQNCNNYSLRPSYLSMQLASTCCLLTAILEAV